MKKILFSLFILVTFISSCTKDPDFDTERRLVIEFFADSIGEDMIAGQDTLVINEFKFIVDKFKLETIDDGGFETTDAFRPFLFSFQRAFVNNQLVVSSGLGITEIDAFNSYTATIDRVRSTDSGLPLADFFGSGETFSLVIRGTFNSAPFEEKMKPKFDVTIDFLPVELTNRNETLLLVKSLDLRDIFVNEAAGTILDPSIPDNEPLIEDLLKNSLRISARATSSFR